MIEPGQLQVIINTAVHEVPQRGDRIGNLKYANPRPDLVGFFDGEA